MTRIIGQENIASLFGVASKTIGDWQESGFPVAARGGPNKASEFDSVECIQWLVDREVRKVRAENPKDRLHRLQGDDLEMKLAVARGELVRADEVEPAMKAAIVTARERIRSEPARLAIQMEGADTAAREALLRDLFDDVLTKLGSWRQPGVEVEAEDDECPD